MERILESQVYTWVEAYNMEIYDILNLPSVVKCQNIETLYILKEKIDNIGISRKIDIENLTIKL